MDEALEEYVQNDLIEAADAYMKASDKHRFERYVSA